MKKIIVLLQTPEEVDVFETMCHQHTPPYIEWDISNGGLGGLLAESHWDKNCSALIVSDWHFKDTDGIQAFRSEFPKVPLAIYSQSADCARKYRTELAVAVIEKVGDANRARGQLRSFLSECGLDTAEGCDTL